MRWWVVMVVACGSTPAPRPQPQPQSAQPFEVVATTDGTLTWFVVGNAGIRSTRTVAVPDFVTTIGWVHHSPVLLLSNHDVGVVTAKGFELLALPPDSAWGMPRTDTLAVRMFTKDDAIWVGHCDQGRIEGFGSCSSWTDVRVQPAPIVVEHADSANPYLAEAKPPPWPVDASRSIEVALVPDIERHAGKLNKLRCAANGKTVEDPPIGGLYEPTMGAEGGRDNLIWLATEPPIFEVTDRDNCGPLPCTKIFEGCTESNRLTSVKLFGPDSVIVFGEMQGLSLYRHGKRLGLIQHATELAFVPR
ncbi:MAG: hypothetical protein ABI867_43585 [Kofleriaceae bacterium]